MKYIFLLSTFVLCGCGGRVAVPVSLQNSYDANLSCEHLSGEKSNHNKRLLELTGERKDKPVHNLGMLVASPLFLDLSNAQKVEAKTISKRMEKLDELAINKNCLPI